MILRYRKRKIRFNARKAGFLGKVFGLMLRTRKTKNILFVFSQKTKISIHSWFVFFSFLAVWMDENNNVIEYRVVRPFSTTIRPKKLFKKLLEIPFNRKNERLLGFFVGKERLNDSFHSS